MQTSRTAVPASRHHRHRSSLQRFVVISAHALAILLHATGARAEELTLERAVTLARERSVPVVGAEGQAAVARASIEGARASRFLNPSVEILGDRGAATADVQLAAMLDLSVEVNGQRSARIAEAEALSTLRGHEVLSIRRNVTADAVARYGALAVAVARVAETARGEAEARKEREWVAARRSVGDATIFEESLATAEQSRWSTLRAEAEVASVAAAVELAELTGLPSVSLPPGARPETPIESVVFWLATGASPDAVTAAVDRSPELTTLRANETYWHRVRDRAEAERNGPVRLLMLAGRGDQGEARLGAGFGMSFPWIRKNQGEIARATAEAARVTALAARTREVFVARLRGALDIDGALAVALGAIDTSGIPAAERAVESAVEAYRAGKIELATVLLARRELATARARRLDLIQSRWRALSMLAGLARESDTP